jgi:hypothetical protein
MSMQKWTQLKWIRRGVPLLLLAGALGTGAFALTASNTFGSSAGGSAGEGAGTISGFTIGAPTYSLDTTGKITSFTFHLSNGVTTGTTVKAGVVTGTLADGGCVLGTVSSAATDVTCAFNAGSEPAVSAADKLTVIASN